MKGKITFSKIFCTKRIFLESQCLVDNLVGFLGLSMFINVFFTLP